MPPEKELFDEVVMTVLQDIAKSGKYIVGVILGLAAKVAVLHKNEKLSFADVMRNAAIAMAAAYLVYHILIFTGNENVATPISVLCGRYSDDVLNITWLKFKKIVDNFTEKKNQ